MHRTICSSDESSVRVARSPCAKAEWPAGGGIILTLRSGWSPSAPLSPETAAAPNETGTRPLLLGRRHQQPLPLPSSCQPGPGSERRLHQHSQTDSGEVSAQRCRPRPRRAGARNCCHIFPVAFSLYSRSDLSLLTNTSSRPSTSVRWVTRALFCPERHFPLTRSRCPPEHPQKLQHDSLFALKSNYVPQWLFFLPGLNVDPGNKAFLLVMTIQSRFTVLPGTLFDS